MNDGQVLADNSPLRLVGEFPLKKSLLREYSELKPRCACGTRLCDTKNIDKEDGLWYCVKCRTIIFVDKKVEHRRCIECRTRYSLLEGRHNPYWCPECDKKRIARISAQMDEIARKRGIKLER